MQGRVTIKPDPGTLRELKVYFPRETTRDLRGGEEQKPKISKDWTDGGPTSQVEGFEGRRQPTQRDEGDLNFTTAVPTNIHV